MSSTDLTLELCDEVVSTAATEDDIARALERQPRDEDWFLTLTRENEDFMDVTVGEDGSLQVQCSEGGQLHEAASVVDDSKLKELLLSFLRADGAWRNQATWTVSPEESTPATTPRNSVAGAAAWIGIGIGALMIVLMFVGRREWIVVAFAAAFPAIVAIAVLAKMREVRRAASWKQGTARIVRSELVTEQRNGKDVKLPAVEYEFNVGFNVVRGSRITLGEIMGDSPQVEEALKRYRLGTSAPVYYDPADPRESVLERDLPPGFAWIWVFVAVLAVGAGAVAYWFVR